MDDKYRAQVSLLVRSLPAIGLEGPFALKGGTAINLFVRDLPRLSVDIDLTYLPIQDRVASLDGIAAELKPLASYVQATIPGARVQQAVLGKERVLTKLLVQDSSATIKVEVTPVLRGAAFDPVVRKVTPRVEEESGSRKCCRHPTRTSGAASSPPPWTASIHATCSTLEAYSTTVA